MTAHLKFIFCIIGLPILLFLFPPIYFYLNQSDGEWSDDSFQQG